MGSADPAPKVTGQAVPGAGPGLRVQRPAGRRVGGTWRRAGGATCRAGLQVRAALSGAQCACARAAADVLEVPGGALTCGSPARGSPSIPES